jgi:signal transduction histidine kinase
MDKLTLKILSKITDSIVIFDSSSSVIFSNLEKSRFKGIVSNHKIVDDSIMRFATKIADGETEIIPLLNTEKNETDYRASIFMDDGTYCLHIIDELNEARTHIATDNILELINHELRTPMQIFMTGVSLVAENLLENSDREEDKEDFKSLVDITIRSAEKVTNKMDKLSALALTYTTDPINSNDRIQLVELVYSAIDSLNTLSKSKNILVNVDIKSGIIGNLYGSFEWLKRAIEECLRNSIEHSNNNSEIHVQLKQSRYFVHITVRNFGEGVAPNVQRTLYEPFRGGGDKAEPANQGLGIGLTLAKKIIESYGGSIKDVAILEGVEFHIELPTGGAVRLENDSWIKQSQIYARDMALLMKLTYSHII